MRVGGGVVGRKQVGTAQENMGEIQEWEQNKRKEKVVPANRRSCDKSFNRTFLLWLSETAFRTSCHSWLLQRRRWIFPLASAHELRQPETTRRLSRSTAPAFHPPWSPLATLRAGEGKRRRKPGGKKREIFHLNSLGALL